METLIFDCNNLQNKFKVLNATNGGPIHSRHATDQYRDNLKLYKEARIPFSRNHDSNYVSNYGGPYAHDISAIFPNFDADENDENSYDFACTDENILVTLEANCQTFFRLGQTIEHQIKKHHIFPPKDYLKWAKICEHIILHYNEGWANGFHLNIQYFEIWNEPDLDKDDCLNKRTWNGSKKQFFDFYECCAKYLKKKFPHLQIGGPALAYDTNWAKEFLQEMHQRNVPIDFFSWHIYCQDINNFKNKALEIKKLLVDNHYENAKSICNEWNYIENWTDKYIDSLKVIHGMKGAAFIMAIISSAMNLPVDMLMYYDTRPSVFNGIFDYYTLEPLKGYYSFKWYGLFYDCINSIVAKNSIEDIYYLCGIMPNKKVLACITYYTSSTINKEICLDFNKNNSKYEIYLLSNDNDATLIETTSSLSFTLSPNTCILIKEI